MKWFCSLMLFLAFQVWAQAAAVARPLSSRFWAVVKQKQLRLLSNNQYYRQKMEQQLKQLKERCRRDPQFRR